MSLSLSLMPEGYWPVSPHEVLLLGVDADHRVAGPGVLGDLPCQITELGVPVGMLIAFGLTLALPCRLNPSETSIRATAV